MPHGIIKIVESDVFVMHYKIIYNDDKNEAYIDAYKKWENYSISLANIKN